jgi:hypothetical protein
MKRKLIICFLIATALVAGLSSHFATIRGYFAGEPFYRGKPARYWSRELEGWWEMPRFYFGPPYDKDLSKEPAPGWQPDPPVWNTWVHEHAPSLWRYLPKSRRKDIQILEGDPAALDVLLVLLDGDSPKVRAMAAHGLGHINKKASVPALRRHLKDTDSQVRIEAEFALKNIDH